MIVSILPVIPPELRPLVPLEGVGLLQVTLMIYIEELLLETIG